MLIRLFTAGTHNNLNFSNEDISNIYTKSKKDNLKIPFVLGHPKNDLPILGWLSTDKIKLYEEGENKSIGFLKEDADFSEESLNALRELKQNKISIRLLNGAISHAGFVKTPAVKINDSQDFTDKENACFEFMGDFEVADTNEHTQLESGFKTLLNEFKNYFKTNKTQLMPEAKLQDFSFLEKENIDLKTQLENLKKANADFEEKVKAEKQAVHKKALEEKIKFLKYNEEESKKAVYFGTSLLEKDENLFATWLEGLQEQKPAITVVNGSVVDNAKDFNKNLSAEDILTTQFNQLKN